jgi:hypothetical protein
VRAGLDVRELVTELIAVRPGIGRPRRVRTATVTAEPPQVAASGPAPGQPLIAIRVSLQVTPSRLARVAAVYVRARLDDPRVIAVQMSAERARPESVDGLDEHGFGWFFGDLSGRPGPRPAPAGRGSWRIVVTAVIKVPDDLPSITGTVRVHASTVRGLLRPRLEHAMAREPLAIELAPPRGPAQASVRLCLAADIERFSRFPGPQATLVQQQFDQVMAQARDRAGAGVSEAELQRSGDGQAAALPAGIDESTAIPLLVTGLVTALAQVNSGREADRIRIRVALDRGHLSRAANGWVGNSIITVHRLLDSPAARQALADRPQADLVLIVSDVLYRDVIAHGYGDLPAQDFRPVLADLPAKGFQERAWVYVPAGPPGEQRHTGTTQPGDADG